MSKIWMLVLGGSVGTLARYFLSSAIYQLAGSRFPYGTMAVNLLGCFLVGLFIVLTEENAVLNPNLRILLMVGFCGAFTTFSAFIIETAHLIRDGETMLALGNVVGSVLLSFIFFKFGILLGESF